MRPVLYDLWGVPISAFGVFLLLAFFAAISVARRSARQRLGADPNWVLDLSLYAIIAGIVGGRIGYILVNIGQFSKTPVSVLTIWRDGGLVFYGAVAAALLLVRASARRKQVSFGALVDAFAAPMVLGFGIAMIGALLHGLLVGKATGVPWAVEMFLDRRHPTQLYLLAASVATLIVLRAQRDRRLADGTLFSLALLMLSVGRFVVDFFVEAPQVAGFVTAGQLASGAVAVVTLLTLLVLSRGTPPEEEPAAEASG